MQLMRGGKAVWAVAAATAVCAAVAGVVVWRAGRALRVAEGQVTAEGKIPVEVRAIGAQPNPGFVSLSAPAVFQSAAWFDGSFYMAGPAGLFAWSPKGALEHVFRPGQDFPATELGEMAVGTLADSRRPELLIATNSEGVLAFDGAGFRQILPAGADARRITALLPLPSGRLLLGTARLGLLVYDGRTLREFHSTTSHVYVTALAGSEADLWIGTIDKGLLHWRGGETEWIGTAQGLADARIECLVMDGNRVFAGTPVGVAELEGDRVARVLARGRFAHALAVDGDALLVGQIGEGVARVPLSETAAGAPLRRPISAPLSDTAHQPGGETIEQFLESGGKQYAVAANGMLQRQAGGGWQQVLSGTAPLLTARHISALMAASEGTLWVGYFDRGLDILPATGGPARHVEDEHVFCVNRILADPQQGAVAVATANGLAMFDNDGRERQVLERKDGLIADDVMDVALYGGGLAAATPAGITFFDAGGASSVYAFEGLVNNHVYALGADRGQLLAGTLGGLSLLEGEAVRRNFTSANSGLRHNWITSLVRADQGWLIGTYGEGVMRMSGDGTITATEATRDGVIVNPTALLADGDLVLAGTLSDGLLVGDASGMRWKTVTAGLPSLDVTALAADHGVIYVGTESGLVKIPENRLQ
jgi:ligand-binding sensor domain-containing protein